jgi:hypothetical protein
MSEPERNGDQTPISDDVARRILERAAEIDRGRSEADDRREDAQLTVAELRQAATEAGISKEAFEAALEQVNATEPSAPTSRPGRLSRLKSVVAWSGGVGGGIGMSAGVIARLLSFGTSATAVSFGVATGATIYLALRHRPGGRVAQFVVSAIVLWLYLLAGFVVGAGAPTSALPSLLTAIGGMAAGGVALGVAIVSTPPSMDDDSDEASFAARK